MDRTGRGTRGRGGRGGRGRSTRVTRAHPDPAESRIASAPDPNEEVQDEAQAEQVIEPQQAVHEEPQGPALHGPPPPPPPANATLPTTPAAPQNAPIV